jgi:hypothetical protein
MNWSLQKLNVACAKKIENKESPPKVVTPTVNEESAHLPWSSPSLKDEITTSADSSSK